MTASKEMFLPGSRNEWTSMVRPPDGYRLEAAVGTTYSLDFTALTAVLLASLDQQSDQQDWEDQAQLLNAITRIGDRVRVLVNRGQIHAEVRSSNRIFALFDRMIAEVRHANGNFHPKVWLLKYSVRQALDVDKRTAGRSKGPASDAIYRLICTSRNLTLASTWEAVVCVEGKIAMDREGAAVQVGRSVAAFFERASADDGSIPKSCQRLLKEIGRVSFSIEGSTAVRSCDFFWQWPGLKGLDQRLDSGGKIALMVSPFVKAGFLKSLATKFSNVIVVSRQEELDSLWATIQNLIPLENFWVVKSIDGDSEAESMDSLELHAKILLCEYARHKGAKARTEAWIGSANASGSAWGVPPKAKRMNCEAMVRFRPGIAPKEFLEQFAYRQNGADQKEEAVLNGWIERYQPRPVEALTDEERADESLEFISAEIGALHLRARFTRTDNSLVMTLDSVDRDSWTALFVNHQGILFEACPMGISDAARFRNLGDVATEGVRFEDMSIAQVGALLLIQLTHLDTNRKKRFAVKAVTEMDDEFWEERRITFLRENLSERDFRTFLRAILFGDSLRRSQGSDGGADDGGPTNQPKKHAASLMEDFTVEDVLHSCTEDSSRIDEIDRLVKAFEATEHIDASFRRFWANFREAIENLKKDAAR
jgi:hypothetical protein